MVRVRGLLGRGNFLKHPISTQTTKANYEANLTFSNIHILSPPKHWKKVYLRVERKVTGKQGPQSLKDIRVDRKLTGEERIRDKGAPSVISIATRWVSD